MASQAAQANPAAAPMVTSEQEVKTFVGDTLLNKEMSTNFMSYDLNSLTTWMAFVRISGTVWQNRTLWVTMLKLTIVAMVVAILVIAFVSDPAALKPEKFQDICTFLNVFVGFLIGFFMASSMQRWYNCANGFLELFDAVRNLQMQFYALGVNEDRLSLCVRYGVLSATLLDMQLRAEAMASTQNRHAKAILSEMWEEFATQENPLEMGKFFTPTEKEALRHVDDPSAIIWVWVASLVGRMAQDKEIPPMQSPTYGRVMLLVQNAHAGIRQVRASISVQPPYIYVQMLATLVHINNLLNAMSFGMTTGVAFGTLAMRYATNFAKYESRSTSTQVVQDFQDVLICFCYSALGPFLYQALLQTSICIASPFATPEGKIPTKILLVHMEKDLQDATVMAQNPPMWESPQYEA